jgi:hypothetical protein
VVVDEQAVPRQEQPVAVNLQARVRILRVEEVVVAVGAVQIGLVVERPRVRVRQRPHERIRLCYLRRVLCVHQMRRLPRPHRQPRLVLELPRRAIIQHRRAAALDRQVDAVLQVRRWPRRSLHHHRHQHHRNPNTPHPLKPLQSMALQCQYDHPVTHMYIFFKPIAKSPEQTLKTINQLTQLKLKLVTNL